MTTKIQNVAVIGAGAWGTALAQMFTLAGRKVTLYARDAGLAEKMTATRENAVYLPGVRISDDIVVTGDMAQAVSDAHLVVMVVPAQFTRAALAQLKPLLPAGVPLLSASKGIEIETGKLLSEVAADILPGHPFGVLSGPTFAQEAVRGLPSAMTLATTVPEDTARHWAEALRSATFRPYLSADPVGAEVAGALKNVVAIACGIVEGKKLGQNARAAVMTRGMAEIKRFGLSRGADAETFLGLSGLGDLVLTCNSMSSRNFSLGAALGEGKTLEDILAARKSVAEGVATAEALGRIATAAHVDMPICAAVNAILHHKADVDAVITGLLSRDLKNEKD